MSRGLDQTVMKFQKKDGRFVIADLPDYPTDHENASRASPPASLGRHTSSVSIRSSLIRKALEQVSWQLISSSDWTLVSKPDILFDNWEVRSF